MRFSPTELLIVLAIVLVLFGPKQIPRLTKMFKKSAKKFNEGMESGISHDDDEDEDED